MSPPPLLPAFQLLLPLLPIAVGLVIPRADIHYPDAPNNRTLCITPAPWNQILSFFITNYAARVLTYKKKSGYSGWDDYTSTFQSLFVPFRGISDAANTIARGSRFLGKDDLDRALLATALAVVVRTEDWKPVNGEIVRGCIVTGFTAEEERRRRKRSESRRRHRGNRGRDDRGRRDRDRRSRDRGDLGLRSRERSRIDYHRDEKDLQHPEHLTVPLNPIYPDLDSSDSEEDYESDSPITASVTLVVPSTEEMTNLNSVNKSEYKVHGSYKLPDAYGLATLPPGASIRTLETSNAHKDEVYLSNSYGVAKSFTALIQIISSLYALYTAYGAQADRYGYAAFGFSVLPYTVMSLLNAIANMVESTYDTLYIVKTDVMDEVEKRQKGEIVGEVAELIPAPRDVVTRVLAEDNSRSVDLQFVKLSNGSWRAYQVEEGSDNRISNTAWKVRIPEHSRGYDYKTDPRPKVTVRALGQPYNFDPVHYKRSEKFRKRAVFVITLFSLLTPYIVIGVISKFQPRGSSPQERTFMMGWLVVGQAIGALNLVGEKKKVRRWAWWGFVQTGVRYVVILIGFAMAIGGFVFTARNMRDFGYCIKLGGV